MNGRASMAFRGPLVWWGGIARTVLIVLTALALLKAARAENPIDDNLERRIKAVFVYRFPEFINWPEKGTSTTRPFIINVIGSCTIAEELRHIAAGHNIEGRPITVRQAQEGNALTGSDIVYICDSEHSRLRQIIQNAPSSALIVTESDGALAEGSVINFVLDDFRVRFEISLDAAKHRDLRVSSRLLDVARTVKSGP